MKTRVGMPIALVLLAMLASFAHWLREGNERLQRERTQSAQRLAAVETVLAEERKTAENARADSASLASPTRAERLERDISARYGELAAARPPLPPREPNLTGSQGFIFSDLTGDPEYRNAVMALRRLWVGTKYAAWLQTILPIELRAQAREKLLEREMVGYEVDRRVPGAGTDPHEPGYSSTVARQRMQLSSELRMPLNAEIAALLGEERMQAFDRFESSAQIRESIAPLSTRLSYSEHPLTRAQQEAMVDRFQLNPAHPVPGADRKAFVWEQVRDLFSPAQWVDVEQYGRERGLLPER